jgi:NitT/TauT family transport system permease protein
MAAPAALLRKRDGGFAPSVWRGTISILGVLIFWEIGRRFHFPFLSAVPAPTEVIGSFDKIAGNAKFWNDWVSSFSRVLSGFALAQLIGIPVGLLMAINSKLRYLWFPPLEILRPIPPLAWVPTSIIFWPTTELSIIFVIFLGAFFTVVLNVLGGARSIDERHIRAALSFGSKPRDVFWKIVLPATMPSIITGMAVGMGVTWEVVVAAEMIAGKSGLGYFTWASYVGGNYPQIVVGMISIGIAGYFSSGAIRLLGKYATPWQRQI